jgi:hypothetical protein
MNTQRFEEILNAQIKRCTDTLIVKAREYATDDRLHNFKTAAVLQGITPVQALAGMMAKHTISIYDMCASGKDYPEAMWDEKIGDSINYLLLLRALVEERQFVFKDHDDEIQAMLRKEIEEGTATLCTTWITDRVPTAADADQDGMVYAIGDSGNERVRPWTDVAEHPDLYHCWRPASKTSAAPAATPFHRPLTFTCPKCHATVPLHKEDTPERVRCSCGYEWPAPEEGDTVLYPPPVAPWNKCTDMLPTEKDADKNGMVEVLTRGGDVHVRPWTTLLDPTLPIVAWRPRT